MKTSSYDELCVEEETDNDSTDEYHSHEAPVSDHRQSDSYEASSALTYEESIAQSYEASFAKCKITSVAASHEAPAAGSYESSFTKCSLPPVTESNEASVTKEYEVPIATSYEASFTRCSLPPVTECYEIPVTECYKLPVTESYETPVTEKYKAVTEKYEAPVAEINETQPVAESNEAQIANIAPQTNYTPTMPPPVPKRTLLPGKTTKDTTVTPETPQDISVVTEETDVQNVAYRDIELVSPEDKSHKTETGAERWSDATSVSPPGQAVEDVETVSSDPGKSQYEPVSEMYYTASSEVSLLSDTELADKVQTEDDESKDDRKNVISGHVAAMRERFESMTRTNTPCPDLVRSLSPSLEVFRNLSPSPDRLA